jgi:hypothetical protein
MEKYKVGWYPFTKHLGSDSCWSLSVGPDGRIYAASCCETKAGGIVKVVRYNEVTDTVDYLFDMDKMADDPWDSGRATQCKIHYSFASSLSDGILYMATHLSAPPVGLSSYSPWNYWHDEKRCFRGSALVAWDTKRDSALWTDTLIPKEGCRCLLHDEERNLLYALGYPRDHFYIYDIKKKRLKDVGRIGSVNAQVLFLDRKHRVWTSDDYGHLIRYDPQSDALERSPYILPHDERYQTGWHSVLYDAVSSPEGDCIYAVTWIAHPHLIRIWPEEGEWGRVENLGKVTQERDLTIPMCTFLDHCGGLVFAADGNLYYVASRWRDRIYNPTDATHKEKEGVVWRMNPKTLERQEVALLERPDGFAQYVSRGAVDHNGNLFFGHVGYGNPWVGFFKIEMPKGRKKKNAHLPIRMWG